MQADGVQILNNSNSHWVCVSTIQCGSTTTLRIWLYDSLHSRASSQVVQQIASLLHCTASSFTIEGRKLQHQRGSKDCGLFAIAVATDLCHSQDPSAKHWEQGQMQIHLICCLENGRMYPFPETLLTLTSDEESLLCEQEVKVYCACRKPEDREALRGSDRL